MNYEFVMYSSEIQKDRDKWLAERKKGIGGSDVAAILGVSKWKSAYTLWAEKTGLIEAEDISDKEVVYWGNQLEDLVAKEFTSRTGKRVRRQGMIRRKNMHFALADVDRLVDGENSIVECKTTSAYNKEEWVDDELPDAYYVQVQWYMFVGDYEKCYICCLVGGNHYVYKEVPRNDEFINEQMVPAVMHFWSMVESNSAPAPDGSESSSETIKAVYGTSEPGLQIALPSEAENLLKQLEDVKQTEKIVAQNKTEIENKLKNLLGTAEVGTIGDKKVTWKTQAGSMRLDSKSLKAELPEVYAKYAKPGAPVRVLRIGKNK